MKPFVRHVSALCRAQRAIVVNFRALAVGWSMEISRRSLARFILVIVLAVAGAALMVKMDSGGTVWLKFMLYSGSILGTYFLTLVGSCGWSPFRRQPKS